MHQGEGTDRPAPFLSLHNISLTEDMSRLRRLSSMHPKPFPAPPTFLMHHDFFHTYSKGQLGVGVLNAVYPK